MQQPDQGGGWTPDDSFATRLVLLRYQMGLTQPEIAERCGIPLGTWRTWEHGTRPQDREGVVRKIVRATGVNGHWLMWGNSRSACYRVVPPILGLNEQLTLEPPPDLNIVTSAAG